MICVWQIHFAVPFTIINYGPFLELAEVSSKYKLQFKDCSIAMATLAGSATTIAVTNGVVAPRWLQPSMNSTGAAFWELDLESPASLSSEANKPVASPFLAKFLQSQIATAVRAAMLKQPLSSTTPATNAASTPEQQQRPIVLALYKNLVTAVLALKVVDAPEAMEVDDEEADEDEDEDEYPNRKRRRVLRKKQKRRILLDPYHVWFQLSSDDAPDASADGVVYWDEDQDDLPVPLGGKLAILSAGGLLNAISSCFLCATPVVPMHPKLLLQQAAAAGTVPQWKLVQEQSPSLSPVTISHLHAMALALHVAIAEQVKSDIVRTTPLRIQSLLAAELTPAEFQSVRRRLHDTVILGKGVQSQLATNGNDDANDPAVALGGSNASQQHEIDKFKKCPGCGNNDQSEFVLDRKNGDVICSFCGIVVSESIMHEGSQFRKFEGELDRNHHGDAANPLYSNAHNMGTSLSGVMPTTGAGLGGKGSGGRRNLETILKNAHAYTELNVSQFGRTDQRRTRIGYKDRQKKTAFSQMTHAGDALNLHEAVVQRAKELFAGKERVIATLEAAVRNDILISASCSVKVFVMTVSWCSN
jgi:TFIIB zinc-binding